MVRPAFEEVVPGREVTEGRPGDSSRAPAAIWRPDERTEVPPENATSGASPPAPERRRRRRRRRPFLWFTLFLFLLALDGAYVGFKVVSDLRAASTSLADARARFEDGDVEGAEAEIQEALDRARAALSLRPHPAYLVGSLFTDVQAATDIALAAEDVSQAGVSAVEAVRVLGVRSGREISSTVYEDGRIRFDALAEAEPFIAAASDRLDAAARHLAGAPEASLGVVQDAVDEAVEEVDRARATARKGRALFAALPSLLGNDEPKTYLLAFQALGEARATGGVIGFYGVLRAEGGRVSLDHVAPIHDLNRTAESPPVEAPAWFERSYAPQFALRQALQVNVSPRAPVVAEVLLRMYAASTGETLDGVVFMDPITMQALLRSTGPIEVPGFEQGIGPDNAADILLRRSYLDFDDPLRQNVFLGAVVRQFWERIETGEFNGGELAKAVSDQVAGKHLMIYARDVDDRRALSNLEADGDFTAANDVVQLVFNNNYAVNKVDYFLERSIETRIDLTADGDARVRTSVTLRNEAPAGPPSLLLGPAPNKPKDPPGLNRMVLGFLLPKDAEPHQFFVAEGADPQDPFVYSDSGHPVVWDVIEILPGESRTVSTTYIVRDAVGVGADGGDVRFVLWPQTRVTPDDFRVVVSAPDGFGVRGLDEPSERLRGVVEVDGVLDEPQEIRFHMRPL